MSAYLKGEEPKAVTAEHMDRMSRAASMQDALATIRETDVGRYLEEVPINTFDDLDRALWAYLSQRISHVEAIKFLPGDMLKVSRAYTAKYDVSNLKAALLGISTGEKSPMIPVGIIHNNGLLDELSGAENVDAIIEILTKCKLGGYVPILKEYSTTGEARERLLVEFGLDGEYYKSMLATAKSVREGSVLSKAFGLVIDLTNLQIACRAIIEGIGTDAAECTIAGGYMITDKAIRDLLSFNLTDIPRRLENSRYRNIASEVLSNYDRTKSITAVEETIDKHKFRLLKEILSPVVLSPLVMAWYLIFKEVEIRNLRWILKAIADGVSGEEVKRYLVL
jgi:vacuolar-type H+-ATPase subunit C/Vma6